MNTDLPILDIDIPDPPKARKPRTKRKPSMAPRTRDAGIDWSRVPRMLTRDPWDTIGVELHVGRTTCARCGTVHTAPLARGNATVRRVKRKTEKLHAEHLVPGPSPWIAKSERDANAAELLEWLGSTGEAKAWLDQGRAVDIVYHDDWCAACPACVTIAREDPHAAESPQLSLVALWPWEGQAKPRTAPTPKAPPVFREQEILGCPRNKEHLWQNYRTRFLTRMLEAYDPTDPEASDGR